MAKKRQSEDLFLGPEPEDDDDCALKNNKLDEKALEEFELGEIAKTFRYFAEEFMGFLVTSRKAVASGQKPLELENVLGRESVIRLLSADTMPAHPCWGRSDGEEEFSPLWTTDIVTKASRQQEAILKELSAFALFAASLAKARGSSSVLQWARIVDLCDPARRPGVYHFRLNENEAETVFNLLTVATIRLRRDLVIYGLPSFKAAKVPRKKKGRR